MIRLIYFMIRYPLHFIDFFRSSRKYLQDNKLKLIFVLLICSSCGYGQYPRLKTDSRGKVYNANKSTPVSFDTVYIPVTLYYEVKKGKTTFSMKKTKGSKLYTKPTVLYGYAGIQFDSTKYYWHKYVQLQSKGVPDSENKYLKLLNNYKSK